MARFSVETERRDGETLYRLVDSATGAFALVWPAFGNTCLAAGLPAPGGGLVDLILAPETLAHVRERPSWWGVPLLFPWPGRIPQGRYEFQGRRYQLPNLDAHGNAGHGFAKDRAWRVDAAVPDEARAALRCTFDSDDHPDTLAGYPFPYHLEVTYRLVADRLAMLVRVVNPGPGSLPFGFGAHPYFRAPLTPEGARANCLVQVPAARRWNLPRLAELPPCGAVLFADVTDPVADEDDLRRPRPLLDRHYDGGFTDLAISGGEIECFVRDPAAGLEAVMAATANFGTVVAYTSPGRRGICFEPWTCPPNVFSLVARGLAESGLVVLVPGERWEGTMRLSVRAAAADAPGEVERTHG